MMFGLYNPWAAKREFAEFKLRIRQCEITMAREMAKELSEENRSKLEPGIRDAQMRLDAAVSYHRKKYKKRSSI